MAVTQSYTSTEAMSTPGFFAAALGASEHNVFESSFKTGNASLERSANDATDPNLLSVTPHSQAENMLRTATNGSFSPLFGLSPGLSPLGLSPGLSPLGLSPGLSPLPFELNTNVGQQQDAQNASSQFSSLNPQVPSPPHSARSPPAWTAQDSRLPGSSPLHGFLVNDDRQKIQPQHGQITPPSDADQTVTDPALTLDSAGSWDQHKTQQNPTPDSITTSKGKRSRQNNKEEDAAPAKKRQRKPTAKAKSVDDPESTHKGEENQKRSKFLERNRIAASKCRVKKKEWTGNLEARARDLQNEKNQLALIVGSLRDEVVWLKGELLKHTNCGCIKIRQYLNQEVANLAGQPVPSPFQQSRTGNAGDGSRHSSMSNASSDDLPEKDPGHPSTTEALKSKRDEQLFDTLSAELSR